MRAKRRRGGGVLTRMVKYSKDAPHGKKPSLVRRVGVWIGGIVVGAFILAMFVLLLLMVVKPELGIATKEGTFEVLEVQEGAAGFRADEHAVAAVVVTIEGNPTRVPLTAENRTGVGVKKKLQIRYTYTPRIGLVRVESWNLLP
jgi:hypothetical protein